MWAIKLFPIFVRFIHPKLKDNPNSFNMKKFLLILAVPLLMAARLAAQVVDSTDLNLNDVPTVILLNSDIVLIISVIVIFFVMAYVHASPLKLLLLLYDITSHS